MKSVEKYNHFFSIIVWRNPCLFFLFIFFRISFTTIETYIKNIYAGSVNFSSDFSVRSLTRDNSCSSVLKHMFFLFFQTRSSHLCPVQSTFYCEGCSWHVTTESHQWQMAEIRLLPLSQPYLLTSVAYTNDRGVCVCAHVSLWSTTSNIVKWVKQRKSCVRQNKMQSIKIIKYICVAVVIHILYVHSYFSCKQLLRFIFLSNILNALNIK